MENWVDRYMTFLSVEGGLPFTPSKLTATT